MATLSHFPSFPSLTPRKLFLPNQQKHQELKLGWHTQQNPPQKRSKFRVFSIKKSRKVKSNAELCNDIREFLASVGLPEDHVPKMKEFSQHGRSDLAYIVRRRGYKLIGELLTSTKETDVDGSNLEKGVTDNKDAVGDLEVKVTDQHEEPNVMVGGFPSSIEASVVENYSGSLVEGTDINSNAGSDVPVEVSADFSSPNIMVGDFPTSIEASVMENYSGSLVEGTDINLDEGSDVPVEASADVSSLEMASCDLEGHEEKGNNMDEDGSLAIEMESHFSSLNIDPAFNSSDHSQEEPLETPTLVPLGEKDLNYGDEMMNAVEFFDGLTLPLEEKSPESFQFDDSNIVNEVALSTEVFITENHSSSSDIDPALCSDDHSSVPVELSALSLKEKVANFVQHGHLDPVEDNSYGILNESGTDEGEGCIESVDAEEVEYVTSTSEHLENVLNGGDAPMTLNGRSLKSKQAVPAVAENHPLRDENLSTEGQSTRFNEDLDIKTSKRENHVEISQFKLMLHQKELELSRLKEQIENEKRALSILQARAETEISKAQKLISEKDAELHAAEETLSGLVEVQIEYHGDGEIVEVTGSFNGWHHCIKMDPQPLSSITDPVGSRKSKLWSTVLWLYPGVYEIKFIVDGQWKTDPQRESVTHGSIYNNILRVDG